MIRKIKQIKKFLHSMLFLVLILPFVANAQTDVQKLIPPSPDAAGLGNYGNYSANHNSGATNLDIPIHQIQTKKFNIPISINYTGGNGIRVDERSSWIGLGWSLNVGGVISRTIVGDDDLNGFKTVHVPFAAEIGPGGNPIYTNYAEIALRDGNDTEPDNFFFSVNGKSGKFIFGNDGVPLLIDSAPLKISLDGNSVFTIIDEDGTKYVFSGRETVSSTTNSNSSMGGDQMSSGITSWYLTQMVSADGTDVVNFNYSQKSSIFEHSFDFSQIYGPTPFVGNCNGQILLEQEQMSHTLRQYTPLRLSSIVFETGELRFITLENRLDGGGSALKAIELYANGTGVSQPIRLKTFRFNQDYFYTSLSNPINHNSDTQYRLRLKEFEEFDSNEVDSKKYLFDYSEVNLPPINNFAQDEWGFFNGKISNTSLLERQSISTANGLVVVGSANRSVSESDLEAGILKKITYPTKGFTTFDYEPNKYSFSDRVSVPSSITCGASGINNVQTATFVASGFGNTTVRIEFRKIGDLTGLQNRPFVRIRDLTTNQQIYMESASVNSYINSETSISFTDGHQYELYAEAIGNQLAYAIITINYISYQNITSVKNGFGLRVRKISNYDSVGLLSTTNSYSYGVNGSGIGTVISNIFNRMPKSYDKIFQHGTGNSGTSSACVFCTQTRKVFFNGSYYPLSTLNGSPLAYSEITIYNGDENNNLGKSVYGYEIFTDKSLPVAAGYPNTIMQLPYSWANGKLSTTSVYRSVQGGYELQKRKIIEYYDILGAEGRGLKLGYKISASGCFLSPRPISDFYFFDYPIYTGTRIPKKVTELIYESGQVGTPITNVQDFSYNDKYQLIRTVSKGSDNVEVFSELKHPIDMMLSGDDPNGAFQDMVNMNVLSPIVQSKQTKANIAVKGEKINYFSAYPGMYVPSSIEILNVKNDLWEPNLSFSKYSSRGNILSFSKNNGPNSVYLWSYNYQYPICEIKNADYATIESILGGPVEVNSFAASSPTDIEANALVNMLRNSSLLKDAQITSYTYKPLVGMTSQTDAKGMTTYYEYDAFQRLLSVKDQNSHIVKSNDYHFKP